MPGCRFSCVIPVKGKRPYFEQALASLYSQGDDNLEIIVQDGDVETDSGQSNALNKGFAKAHGDWIFWLNADDVLLPGSLEKVGKLIDRLEHVGRVDWIAGNVVYTDKFGCTEWCAWDRGWKLSYAGLPVQVYGPSSFFRKELLEQAGGLDETLKYTMDVDLWCKFRKLGYWYRKVPDFLWGFRLHEESKTSNAQQGKWNARQIREMEMVFARYGLKHVALASSLARLTRFVNGSYAKSWVETIRRKNKSVL